MPRSKSKRRRYQPPPKPKPPPSPRWVAIVFFTLLGAGFITILTYYIFGEDLALLRNPWVLWAGLGLIAASFIVATRIR